MSVRIVNTPWWIPWFKELGNVAEVKARAKCISAPLQSQTKLSSVVACESLRMAWRDTYVPNDAHLAILQQFIERARFSAVSRLPSMAVYETAVYNRNPIIIDDQEIWGLTGLAGVGKSSSMAALCRLLTPKDCAVISVPGVQVRPKPVVHISIKAGMASSAVLRSLANPLFVAGRANIPPFELKQHLQQWLYAQSTLLILVDELQFLTRSQSASTVIANLISEINELGPPVAYVYNYSLGHKLMARQHEDKDRLLAKQMVLHPPEPDDLHWVQTITEYFRFAPHLFDIDAERYAAELHQLTAGLLRLLRLLLTEACRQAWHTHADRPVVMADVRAAYRSAGFCSQREDVEALKSLAFNSGLRHRRQDLVCPFGDLRDGGARSHSSAKPPTTPTPAARHMVESAINAEGRKVLQELRAAADDVSRQVKAPATVTTLRRRSAPTVEDLLAGAKRLTDSVGTKSPGKPLRPEPEE